MDKLQELVESVLNQIPKFALEIRLAEKMKDAGLSVDEETLSRAAEHILSDNQETFEFGGNDDDVTIQITNEDIEYVVKATERFHNEQLAGVCDEAGDDIADHFFKFLSKRWPDEFTAHQADVKAFKERLEHRWGKALGKLRMLLAIVTEWAQGFYERRRRVNGGRLSHLDDVVLRLHVRACQVTGEIIVLLENGYADGAMARWRTLHEITTSKPRYHRSLAKRIENCVEMTGDIGEQRLSPKPVTRADPALVSLIKIYESSAL
jgi:hypothetical protein